MATSSVMTSVQRLDGNVTVLFVSGDIDMDTASAFADAVVAAQTPSGGALIVDLTGVEFMSSAGLRILMQAHEEASPETDIAVVADAPVTRRPIELTGLSDLLATFPTLESALYALRHKRPDP